MITSVYVISISNETNTLCIFIFLQPLPLTIYLKLNFLPPPHPLHYFRFCTFGYHGIRNAKHSDTCTSINLFFHFGRVGWKFFCFRCAGNVREKEKKINKNRPAINEQLVLACYGGTPRVFILKNNRTDGPQVLQVCTHCCVNRTINKWERWDG